MSLSPGTKLAHYEILEPIGKGGMGEVYRARDTKLGRDVAIKALPEEFAKDKERLARFEREAKLLASLNHPNIASIYGLEESDGVKALILELVEGPTLAERIAEGPIPVEEALPIARQITAALEAGHEAGVIHRDLKPANVKVKEDGTVKVLDYGLAKALEGDRPAGADAKLSQSPTLTRQGTQIGVILGTAAYMSPEQAKGKRVDKRADIWAFGAVVYEMLTGKPAFEGSDISDTLANVLKTEPTWDTLPTALSSTLTVYIKRCLHKDSKQRVHDIADARLALEGAFDPTESPLVEAATAAQSRGQRVMPWVMGAIMGGVLVGAILWWVTQPVLESSVLRVSLAVEPSAPPFVSSNYIDLAISPDGQRIVYRTGDRELQILSLSDGEQASLVTGIQLLMPFFSPDGEWVGFLDQPSQELKRISVNGGAVETIARVGVQLRGLSWAMDGAIVYASAINAGLWRVSATGGEPEQLTTPGEGETHWWPSFLPDGQSVLFAAGTAQKTTSQIAVLSLGTRSWDVLQLQGTAPQYLPTGHLLYATAGTLRAVAFNPTRGLVTGESVAVETNVSTKGTGAANYAVSQSGTLLYLPAGSEPTQSLGWVTRDGEMIAPLLERRAGVYIPRLSPEGARVAYANDQPGDIWVRDLARGSDTRVTSEGENAYPAWGPGDDTLTFTSNRAGQYSLYSQSVDLSRDAEMLTASPSASIPGNWSRDGQVLVYYEVGTAGSNRDIWTLSQGSEPRPFLATAFNERAPQLSPDGRWLAYVSDQSGKDQVYLTPFPDGGRVLPVSTAGGDEPRWSRDGRELFYRQESQMWSVAVDAKSGSPIGRATLLFDKSYNRESNFVGTPNYDVSLDGRQFLMVRSEVEATVPMTLVLNWFEELKRLVPAN